MSLAMLQIVASLAEMPEMNDPRGQVLVVPEEDLDDDIDDDEDEYKNDEDFEDEDDDEENS